jgi:DNA-binding response OmpR family regulator
MSRRRRRRGSGKNDGHSENRSRNDSQNRGGKPEGAKEAEGQKGNTRHFKANMVVLVDSDPAYVEMESMGIVNYISGFNPMGFTGLSRALNYITNPRNEGRVGLVLLDLEVPSLDGLSVGNIVEAVKKGGIPLALVSQHNTAENVELVIKLGAVGFLPKVFTLEIFVRFVKNILRNGFSNSWQCASCGKLVPVDQTDFLNMGPLKCSNKNCESSVIKEVCFGSSNRN